MLETNLIIGSDKKHIATTQNTPLTQKKKGKKHTH